MLITCRHIPKKNNFYQHVFYFQELVVTVYGSIEPSKFSVDLLYNSTNIYDYYSSSPKTTTTTSVPIDSTSASVEIEKSSSAEIVDSTRKYERSSVASGIHENCVEKQKEIACMQELGHVQSNMFEPKESIPDGASNIKIALNNVPNIESVSKKLEIKTATGKVAVIEAAEEKLPAIELETNSTSEEIPETEAVSEVPFIESASDEVSAIESVPEEMPAIESASEEVSAVEAALKKVPKIASASKLVPEIESSSEYNSEMKAIAKNARYVEIDGDSASKLEAITEDGPKIEAASDQMLDLKAVLNKRPEIEIALDRIQKNTASNEMPEVEAASEIANSGVTAKLETASVEILEIETASKESTELATPDNYAQIEITEVEEKTVLEPLQEGSIEDLRKKAASEKLPIIKGAAGNVLEIEPASENVPEMKPSSENVPEIDPVSIPSITLATENVPEIKPVPENVPIIKSVSKNVPPIEPASENIPKIEPSSENVPQIEHSSENAPESEPASEHVPELNATTENTPEKKAAIENVFEIETTADKVIVALEPASKLGGLSENAAENEVMKIGVNEDDSIVARNAELLTKNVDAKHNFTRCEIMENLSRSLHQETNSCLAPDTELEEYSIEHLDLRSVCIRNDVKNMHVDCSIVADINKKDEISKGRLTNNIKKTMLNHDDDSMIIKGGSEGGIVCSVSGGSDKTWSLEYPLTTQRESKAFKSILPKTGEIYQIFVTQVNGDLSLDIQLTDEANIYNELNGKISTFINADKCEPLALNAVPNTFCIAKYTSDGCWYRARYLTTLGENLAYVVFIDFGNYESVPRNTIYELPEQFWDIPARAFNVELNMKEVCREHQDKNNIEGIINQSIVASLTISVIFTSGDTGQLIVADIFADGESLVPFMVCTECDSCPIIDEGSTEENLSTCDDMCVKHSSASEECADLEKSAVRSQSLIYSLEVPLDVFCEVDVKIVRQEEFVVTLSGDNNTTMFAIFQDRLNCYMYNRISPVEKGIQSSPCIGSFYVALHEPSGYWKRVVVLERLPNNLVAVHALDYGTIFSITTEKLCTMPYKFTQLEGQSIQCVLNQSFKEHSSRILDLIRCSGYGDIQMKFSSVTDEHYYVVSDLYVRNYPINEALLNMSATADFMSGVNLSALLPQRVLTSTTVVGSSKLLLANDFLDGVSTADTIPDLDRTYAVPEAELHFDKPTCAVVANVEEDCSLVCLQENACKWANMKEELQSYMASACILPYSNLQLDQECYCIAKHQTSGEWYRGKILTVSCGVSLRDPVVICDIDTGNKETHHMLDIFPMQENFSSIPARYFRVSLEAYECPNHKECTAIEKLNELVGKTLVMDLRLASDGKKLLRQLTIGETIIDLVDICRGFAELTVPNPVQKLHGLNLNGSSKCSKISTLCPITEEDSTDEATKSEVGQYFAECKDVLNKREGISSGKDSSLWNSLINSEFPAVSNRAVSLSWDSKRTLDDSVISNGVTVKPIRLIKDDNDIPNKSNTLNWESHRSTYDSTLNKTASLIWDSKLCTKEATLIWDSNICNDNFKFPKAVLVWDSKMSNDDPKLPKEVTLIWDSELGSASSVLPMEATLTWDSNIYVEGSELPTATLVWDSRMSIDDPELAREATLMWESLINIGGSENVMQKATLVWDSEMSSIAFRTSVSGFDNKSTSLPAIAPIITKTEDSLPTIPCFDANDKAFTFEDTVTNTQSDAMDSIASAESNESAIPLLTSPPHVMNKITGEQRKGSGVTKGTMKSRSKTALTFSGRRELQELDIVLATILHYEASSTSTTLWVLPDEDKDTLTFVENTLEEEGNAYVFADDVGFRNIYGVTCKDKKDCSLIRRIMILSTTLEHVNALYIDTGERQTVKREEIKELPNYLTTIPPLAVQLFLPLKVSLPAASEYLENNVLHRACAYTMLDLKSKKIPTLFVVTKDCGNLAKYLVKNELAEYKIGYSLDEFNDLEFKLISLLNSDSYKLCPDKSLYFTARDLDKHLEVLQKSLED